MNILRIPHSLSFSLALALALLATSNTHFLPQGITKERALQLNNASNLASSFLQLLNETNASPIPPSLSANIPFSAGNGITLVFSFIGLKIPPEDADDYLYWAYEKLLPYLQTQAYDPISGNRWAFGDLPLFQIIVAAFPGKVVTYSQLSTVIDGLRTFMLESEPQHANDLQFEIKADGKGKVGHGLVWHDYSDAGAVAKRSYTFNATSLYLPLVPLSSHPLNSSLTQKKVPFPIPDTNILLTFSFFGDPIPPSEFESAFTAANLEILDYVARYPTWGIPYDRYEYDGPSVHIVIIGNKGIPITFIELFKILQGLHMFVSGSAGGEKHYQLLQFDIGGAEGLGFGLVWYYPPGTSSVA